MRLRFIGCGCVRILAIKSLGKNFSLSVGQRLSYPICILYIMNKHPILPNWQLPRRRPFTARRGIALLRAWRERFAEQPRELHVQMQFAFAIARVSRR